MTLIGPNGPVQPPGLPGLEPGLELFELLLELLPDEPELDPELAPPLLLLDPPEDAEDPPPRGLEVGPHR